MPLIILVERRILDDDYRLIVIQNMQQEQHCKHVQSNLVMHLLLHVLQYDTYDRTVYRYMSMTRQNTRIPDAQILVFGAECAGRYFFLRSRNRFTTMAKSNAWREQTALAVSIATSVAAMVYAYRVRRKSHEDVEDIVNELTKKRQEERTGRIRAEVNLRTALKKLQQFNSEAESNKHEDGCTRKTMLLQCIGTVVSPYTKRMGTPRQATLVPASRGYVYFTVPPATISGIELYSHIWIIFEFHANTDTVTARKTKIRPPRGGGIKVGQLSTRSPHRPNPIGLSLVKVERWDETTRQLHVSGLDLVNGTPVFDIKPVVPWDVPGYPNPKVPTLKVPLWVEQDDEISNVDFADNTLAQLRESVAKGALAPLYTVDNDGFEGAQETVKQILAQDPRSSHKGLKQNARGSGNAGGRSCSSAYSLIFCAIKISFIVNKDGARVTEIVPVDFDGCHYVDGVPLISQRCISLD